MPINLTDSIFNHYLAEFYFSYDNHFALVVEDIQRAERAVRDTRLAYNQPNSAAAPEETWEPKK